MQRQEIIHTSLTLYANVAGSSISEEWAYFTEPVAS